MPQRTALWTVTSSPDPLTEARLPSEQLLEQMIVASPRILSDEWMLIGRQEPTVSGRLDLLGLAPDGTLVLIELKRERTPREVVAQALDYAAWVERLQANDVVAIYGRFAPGRDLAADFLARFGQPLDENTLNDSHQIVIVATQLDDSSERIVQYLGDKGIAINVLCFQVFAAGDHQLLSRTWLMDPVQSQVSAAVPTPKGRREREPWNGEFYACFGHGSTREWAEGRKYGFICAGGGSWYSNTLNLLSVGDRVWVKAPGYGFVGVGEVFGPREGITEFALSTADGDEIGMFGNQNTVCKPTTPKWRTTVDRLKERWKVV